MSWCEDGCGQPENCECRPEVTKGAKDPAQHPDPVREALSDRESVIEKQGREWPMRLTTRGGLVKPPGGVWGIAVVPKEDLEEAERELDAREAEVAALADPSLERNERETAPRLERCPVAHTGAEGCDTCDSTGWVPAASLGEPPEHPGHRIAGVEYEGDGRKWWLYRTPDGQIVAALTGDLGSTGLRLGEKLVVVPFAGDEREAWTYEREDAQAATRAVLNAGRRVREGFGPKGWLRGAPTHVLAELLNELDKDGWRLLPAKLEGGGGQ